jgi:hypothetical protein
MVGGDEAKPLGGRPMEPEAFTDNEDIVSALPIKAHLVSLEAVRFSLPTIKRLIPLLQSMQDQATALTEELNILMDGMLPEDPHIVEISDLLAKIVVEWQATNAAVSASGAILNSIDPVIVEWYGVVDGRLALYCWNEGEADIEWYHWPEEGCLSRRPILEA